MGQELAAIERAATSKECMTDVDQVDRGSMRNHGSPAWTPGLMPPEVRVAELHYYPTLREQAHGNRWHVVPVNVLTIEDARGGRVTVAYAGWVGEGTHLYEVDLTPAAAEELALRLIRRAHEVRHDEARRGQGDGS